MFDTYGDVDRPVRCQNCGEVIDTDTAPHHYDNESGESVCWQCTDDLPADERAGFEAVN